MEDTGSPTTVIEKVIQSETGKYLSRFLLDRLERIAGSVNKDIQIRDSLEKLKISNPEKEVILSRIHDKYLKTRTISNSSQNVDIQDIYHPLTVESDSNLFKRITIDDSNTLPRNKITCLIGKAGQGKTTLLRKLYLNDIIIGDHFPIMIFLRNLDFSEPFDVPEIIAEELKKIGLDIPRDDWSFIIQSGKVNIYWDGFDEIPTKWRAKAVAFIESTWQRFNCPCVVTTRPETEITRYGGSVTNVLLSDLETRDVISIIKKTVHDDPEYVGILTKAVETNHDLSSCLISPIIVDIFIYTYRSLKSDPTSISDFYSELFMCLARQHDKLKLYTREVQSSLTAHQLEQAFKCASFKLVASKSTTFTEKKISDVFSDCCERLNLNNHNNYSHIDIINITNLITPDGYGTYSFIHKSIMEYYSAQFILDLPDEAQKKFFSKFVNRPDESFLNVLYFIKEIDEERFNTLFLSSFLDKLSTIKEMPTLALIEMLIGFHTVNISGDDISDVGWIGVTEGQDPVLFEAANPGFIHDLFYIFTEISSLYSDYSGDSFELLKDGISFYCVEELSTDDKVSILSLRAEDFLIFIKKKLNYDFEIEINKLLDQLFNNILNKVKSSVRLREQRIDLADF